MRRFVLGAVLIAGACIVLWALALSNPSRAISMRVRGFTTNRYVFPNDPDPDFIYAIIEVTNRSRQRFLTDQGVWDSFLLPNVPGFWEQTPKPAGPGFLPPHSGFSFEVVVWRNTTNKIIVPYRNIEPIWPLQYLPARFKKLPLLHPVSPEIQIVTQAVSWGSAMQGYKSSQ